MTGSEDRDGGRGRKRRGRARACLLAGVAGMLAAGTALWAGNANAQQDGMIVIPGRGETAEHALAQVAAPGVQAAAPGNGVDPNRVATVVAGTPATDASRSAPAAPRAIPPRNAAVRPVMPTAPATQQDAETVRRTALAFLEQQATGLPGKPTITVSPALPRGLAACTALEPFLPTGARVWGRTTVGVRCAGERPWTIYLQAKIAIQATYYVAARQIAPGEPLAAADLVARAGDLTMLPRTIVTDPSQAIGATALSRVPAGLPLRQDLLKSAASVSPGQSVRVVAAGQGFTITAEGSTLGAAAPGQPVKVRMAAGQIVTAIVKDAGTVELPM